MKKEGVMSREWSVICALRLVETANVFRADVVFQIEHEDGGEICKRPDVIPAWHFAPVEGLGAFSSACYVPSYISRAMVEKS